MKLLLASALCGAAMTTGIYAQTPAPSQHAVLVELFTSEGCSDCPPAEEVLAKMYGRHTSQGTPIIAISEHVTYFNDAWHDPFSDEIYTDRQAAYADHLHSQSYTPMAVVMGQSFMNGSDGNAIVKAVDANQNPDAVLHIVSAKRDGKKLAIEYSAEGPLPKHGAEIVAFIADDADSTNVPAGENRGRTLHHVSVVRTMKSLGSVKDSAPHTAILTAGEAKPLQHLVLVEQESGTGKVLAAETVALN